MNAIAIAAAPTSPRNMGIVPAWLQAPTGAAAAAAPTTDAALPELAGFSATHTHDHGPRQGAGGIIIFRIPSPRDGGDAPTGRPSVAASDAVRGARGITQAEGQRQAEEAVQDVRGWFSKMGVKDSEGNDATRVTFDPSPDFANAAYDTVSDDIIIGVDPRSGRSFADSTDVVAHEWGHRVAHHLLGRAPITTGSQVAAGEHYADVLAAAYDADDWTIGEGVGEPIRDMAHPERLGHPGSVAELKRMVKSGELSYPVTDESGRPMRDERGRPVVELDWHAVAGVPNKAASMIGDSIGRDAMAQVYLNALRTTVDGSKGIDGVASAVTGSAKALFGADSAEYAATRDAFLAVGLIQGAGASRR